MFASQRYKKEVKAIRNMLSDGEFTRTLLPEYHTFLVDIHTKMLSQGLSSLEVVKVDKALKDYENPVSYTHLTLPTIYSV